MHSKNVKGNMKQRICTYMNDEVAQNALLLSGPANKQENKPSAGQEAFGHLFKRQPRAVWHYLPHPRGFRF
jgi:hypothetical protein